MLLNSKFVTSNKTVSRSWYSRWLSLTFKNNICIRSFYIQGMIPFFLFFLAFSGIKATLVE